MTDLATLKQTVIDLFLGGKQLELGDQQFASLRQYDPDLKVLQDTLTSEVKAGAKARRALISLKPTDLVGFYAAVKANRTALDAVVDIVDAMAKQKVMGASVPAKFIMPLGEARKKDLLAIEKELLHPAVDHYVNEWQKRYEFDNGKVVEKDAEESEEEADELDPALVKKAQAENDEVAMLMAHEKTLFNGKSLLNPADVNTFTKDKLSFLPNAIRGGDTKKLLADEKLSIEAIKQYEALCPHGPGIANAAYELWKINGEAVRPGMTPLMIWKNKPALVAYRDSLLLHLRNIHQHLELWMEQRNTARLDIKSKKFLACMKLVGDVDALIAAYQKVV
jgi:hypothetical protein